MFCEAKHTHFSLSSGGQIAALKLFSDVLPSFVGKVKDRKVFNYAERAFWLKYQYFITSTI